MAIFGSAHTPAGWPANKSLTETGRRLRVQSVGFALAHAFVTHPAVAAVARRWKLAVAAALAAAIIRRKRSKKPEVAPAGAGKGEKAEAVALPGWKELLTDENGRVVGLNVSVAGVASLSCVAAVASMVKIAAMSAIQGAQNSGNMGEWTRSVSKYVATCLVLSASTNGIEYFKSLLTIKWRQVLTTKLHDLYFKNRLYYKLLNEQEGAAIMDADVRIVTLLDVVCSGYAGMWLSLINTFASLLVVGYDLAHRRSFWACLCGPAFAATTFPPLVILSIIDAETVLLPFQRAQSALSQALTRVQLHGDRVRMLRGEGFEYDVVTKRLLCPFST